MNNTRTYFHFYDSPLGKIRLLATDEGLISLTIPSQRIDDHIDSNWIYGADILLTCCHQLDDYFSGELTEFTVPLAAVGTIFQKQVWDALCRVPYGETCSYKAIADSIGNPKAVRAVGAANGKNPIAIIVPCHRVIGTNGKLTGYAGGIEHKAFLLKLEGIVSCDE
ncbi:cysteine methyltransferase [Photobacterium profundum]|uniref:Methylated-DNA--protein-cysteine methyltransferase n=1 Tax=Photobacterium profundum 3TCK TaxID=314280 RepID=Q1YY99_9GAMM|nr:methylated-DNA--[protein]-cysteine S-methyltransferase [Photobacterium profundum]EAS41307.1 methylated-DNA--protein-cysteine S-methyltransferase [Photobacterium profundum 3TCK]PSV62400.1 cysteine methyltransferase [Photobacterium profundum]